MVEYLVNGDKKYPVRVSYHALSMFKKETGSDFDSAAGENSINIIEPLLYYAIESGCKAVGEKFTLKRKSDEFFELLEDQFMSFANLIPKFFPSDDELKKKDAAPGTGNRKQRREIAKTK